ncbi:MAG: helix-turn-helix domain-containing protein [Verrucomicrobiota bacterium]
MKIYAQPDMEDVTLEAVMHALSDPCRLKIIRTLMNEEELACNQLPTNVAKATLSHHMDVLRNAGLISTRMQGAKGLSTVRAEEFVARFPGILDLVKRGD